MSLLLLLLSAASWGQTARFELAPSTSTALIGAPLEMIGTAVFPERYALEAPDKDQSAEPFEILGVSAGPPARKDGMAAVQVRIRTAAFALGEVAFPTLRWTLRAQDGSADSLESAPVRLKVVGPQPKEGSDIRDIAGPIPVAAWPWILLACALAACAAYALHRRRRRPAAAAAAEPVPDARTPDQIAIDDLRALAALDLPVKEYYDRLSDILRLYLDRRFALPALKMTTTDLYRRMSREEGLDAQARTKIKALLDRCDLAKFARFLPTDEERLRDCSGAIEIVELTRAAGPIEEHALAGGAS